MDRCRSSACARRRLCRPTQAMENGPRMPEISGTSAIRRSTKSTRTTSTVWRSPGTLRPVTWGIARNTNWKRHRWESAVSSMPRLEVIGTGVAFGRVPLADAGHLNQRNLDWAATSGMPLDRKLSVTVSNWIHSTNRIFRGGTALADSELGRHCGVFVKLHHPWNGYS